jgi:hypothetical protein
MLKSLSLAVLTGSLLFASTAFAQLEETGGTEPSSGSGGAFGLGMETVLTAPFAANGGPISPAGAAAFSWDSGQFRVDGLLYLLFIEDSTTTFALGGRFFYEMHSTSKADFSLGGGLALGFADSGPGDANIRVAMEGAMQVRVWLASNVALNASAGLGFSVGEGAFVFGLSGQLTGGFGLMYYFD